MGSPEQSIPVGEQLDSPEAYERAGKFFIGKEDAVTPHPVVLETGASYNLIASLPPNSLPPNWDQAQICNDFLYASTRSRLAQAGLNLIGLRFFHNRGRLFARFNARVLGPRPIQLDAGEGLASFFNVDYAEPVVGQELVDLVLSGEDVRISGELREDWLSMPVRVIDRNQNVHVNELDAVALRLKEKRLGIDPSEEPITITSRSQNLNHLGARDVLQEHVFRELDPEERVTFWVGETRSKVALGSNYVGVLTFLASCGPGNWGVQTNSPLIKPGTNNTIRTELWKPKRTEHGLPIGYSGEEEPGEQYVFMRIYRSAS